MKDTMGGYRERLEFLLREGRVDALLVTRLENVRYLSGFTGSAGALLVTDSKGYLISDSRYATQSREQVVGFSIQILEQGERLSDRVQKILKRNRIQRLGFEPDDLRVSQYLTLKKGISPRRLVPLRKGVEVLRMIKSDRENRALARAIRCAEHAFQSVRRLIRAGSSEREIALHLEHGMRQDGANGAAFDTIVASGARGAMPHGIASKKRLRKGDLVIVDFGAKWDGYSSDMTRTFYLGSRLIGIKRKIFDTVRKAQEAAIRAVRPGISLGEIDATARDVIREAGFGSHFGHGTGHGIGLEVHELPLVAPGNKLTVREGMVFTIEPGIYLPGLGGVRIEDMVRVTRNGCQVLTTLGRDWQV